MRDLSGIAKETHGNCTGRSISWLLLEQYHLDELRGEKRQDVAQHLSDCAGCSQRYRELLVDQRPLKPLRVKTAARSRKRLFFGIGWGLSLSAATVALVVMLIKPEFSDGPAFPGHRIFYKGGDWVLTLVRERDHRTVENPKTYHRGDRFKILLTSPESIAVDIAIFQEDRVLFPFAQAITVRPGNRISIPGAFRLTGNVRSRICAIIGPEIPDRKRIADPKWQPMHSQPWVCCLVEPVSTE